MTPPNLIDFKSKLSMLPVAMIYSPMSRAATRVRLRLSFVCAFGGLGPLY